MGGELRQRRLHYWRGWRIVNYWRSATIAAAASETNMTCYDMYVGGEWQMMTHGLTRWLLRLLEVIRKWKCLSFVLEIGQIVERHVSLECAQGLVPPVFDCHVDAWSETMGREMKVAS